jgi:single-strand DNA-binding protein
MGGTMASFNKVLLMGNLTREPEIRYTPSGAAVCEFGMAINRTYTSNNEKKEEVCFVDINVWGKQAETCSRYLQKGSPLFVEGRLQLDQWNDKETGKSRSKLRVVAERTQFLGSPGNKEDFGEGKQSNDYSSNKTSGTPAPQQQNPPPSNNQGFNNNQGSFPAPPQQQSPTPAAGAAAPAAPAAPAQGTPFGQQPGGAAPQGGAFGQQQAPQQPLSGPNNAFNPNMGSEDDIPF